MPYSFLRPEMSTASIRSNAVKRTPLSQSLPSLPLIQCQFKYAGDSTEKNHHQTKVSTLKNGLRVATTKSRNAHFCTIGGNVSLKIKFIFFSKT